MPLLHDALIRYAERIRSLRAASADVIEPALAPAFERLLSELLAHHPWGQGLTVVPEYRAPGIGRPDLGFVRGGQPSRAFIELKSPARPADPTRWREAHDKRQASRLRELACWASSNFIDIHAFERAEERMQARILPARALEPDCPAATADRLIRAHDASAFLGVIERLASAQPPQPRDARQLAHALAHASRLVKSIVEERLLELRAARATTDPLLDVHQEFRTVLYARPEAGGFSAADFDATFASAFAQTLAFGLLLVREGTMRAVDARAHEQMPAEHPLMRTALRVLMQPEISELVGIGFTVLLDTVNSFAPELLAAAEGRPDPILYFYEDFLGIFDAAAREKHGVWFTPVEVVRYIVGALGRVAREHLGLSGLGDERLTILDPATGTGTFLLAVAERVREAALARGGEARAALALRSLTPRMFGFELLVGPYAVAHYRLHHALRVPGAAVSARLGVYLTDTLAPPGATAPLGQLGFLARGIRDEREAADEVKTRRPVLAIIGNPPYRRLEAGETRTLVGPWMDTLWDDLKAPVRDARQGNQLNTFPELSVAFWRWAIWKLFEAEGAPRRGVVAFITNRKFLTGWPYAGLRRRMRERFDRIEVIDLRGDARLGARAGIEGDENVFDIMVGTAITVAIADGSRRGAEGEVLYFDSWAAAAASRRAKLDLLAAGTAEGRVRGAAPVGRAGLEDFRPRAFAEHGYADLRSCFVFASSGIQTKRDALVYDADRVRLETRIRAFHAAPAETASTVFHSSRDRSALEAHRAAFDASHLRTIAYRPLDRRTVYLHPRFGDFLRPEFQQVWGSINVALYALPRGTGRGPAVWCHALLPDYHAFRGSYGGYAFPLHDRRAGGAADNLAPALVAALSAAYGRALKPQAVFDAMLCLLSASRYTQRFAEDLEDVFPHVPFPGALDVFTKAAALGARIRAAQTFDPAARLPAARDPAFVRLDTAPSAGAVLAAQWHEDGRLVLAADGSGRVSGLPAALWRFEVSGYPVLQRWLEGREGLDVDLELFDALRDVCARIIALQALFARADAILDAAIAAPWRGVHAPSPPPTTARPR